MKTFDKKDVCTIVNAQTAYKYIGDNGYFSDHLDPDLKNWRYGELLSIHNDDYADVDAVFGIADQEDRLIATDYYGLFLPACKAIEKENKWRAFRDTQELKTVLNLGSLLGRNITIRRKENLKEYVVMICGVSNTELLLPSFGSWTMPHLFKNYEIKLHGEWQPFGVIEE
jgi:hypothetical protein